MKYPLAIVRFMMPDSFKVVDATHKVILHIADDDAAVKLVTAMVRRANRRARWFGAPKSYSREDWLFEKNTFGVSK